MFINRYKAMNSPANAGDARDTGSIPGWEDPQWDLCPAWGRKET